MPGFDATGPAGRGPMTGRRRGIRDVPGKRGYRYYRYGAGYGHGWRHCFWASGVSGRGWWKLPYTYHSLTKEEEIELLKEEADALQSELKSIQGQIEEMSKNQSENKSES